MFPVWFQSWDLSHVKKLVRLSVCVSKCDKESHGVGGGG